MRRLEYQEWRNTIKQRIVSVRLRMALAANRELILFYWELGAMIVQKQAQSHPDSLSYAGK